MLPACLASGFGTVAEPPAGWQRRHSGLSAVARLTFPWSHSRARSFLGFSLPPCVRLVPIGAEPRRLTAAVLTTELTRHLELRRRRLGRVALGFKTKKNGTGPLATSKNQGTSILNSEGPTTDRSHQIYSYKSDGRRDPVGHFCRNSCRDREKGSEVCPPRGGHLVLIGALGPRPGGNTLSRSSDVQ
jgi:hypothetical protein